MSKNNLDTTWIMQISGNNWAKERKNLEEFVAACLKEVNTNLDIITNLKNLKVLATTNSLDSAVDGFMSATHIGITLDELTSFFENTGAHLTLAPAAKEVSDKLKTSKAELIKLLKLRASIDS